MGPMSRSWLQAAFALLLLQVASMSFTQTQPLPELLKPVAADTTAKLQAKTNYGFRRQLYVAKRYRIVEIDFSLLEREDAEFTITPFDDLQTVVRTKRIAGPSSGEHLREWTGVVDNSSVKGFATAPNGQTLPIPTFPVALWIRSGEHEVPVQVAQQVAAERGDKPRQQFLAQPAQLQALPGAQPRVTSKLNLQTLSGEWFLLAKAKRVVIRPIEDDPRYHVIYEEDSDKMASGAHQDEKSTQKLRAAEQFRQQLEQERLQDAAKQP